MGSGVDRTLLQTGTEFAVHPPLSQERRNGTGHFPRLPSLHLRSRGNDLLLKESRWDDKRQQKGQKERLRGQQIKQSS